MELLRLRHELASVNAELDGQDRAESPKGRQKGTTKNTRQSHIERESSSTLRGGNIDDQKKGRLSEQHQNLRRLNTKADN